MNTSNLLITFGELGANAIAVDDFGVAQQSARCFAAIHYPSQKLVETHSIQHWSLRKDGQAFCSPWPVAIYYSVFGLSKMFPQQVPAWMVLVSPNWQEFIVKGFYSRSEAMNYVTQNLLFNGNKLSFGPSDRIIVGDGVTTIAYAFPLPRLA